MSDDRCILHVDMDAFFAAIEQRDDPTLRGKPLLIGGTGPRGVVSTASYEARPFGCHSAMPMSIARRLCPEAIVLKPNGPKIRAASRALRDILHRYTPLVQPISVDEAFLDVTASIRLFGEAATIAQRIQDDIRHELQLTGSIGIAPNKFLAKLASDFDKPDGLTIVPADDITGWLADLPVDRMWGVGPSAQRKLAAMSIHTFGDLQRADHALIRQRFGAWGEQLLRLAHGIDERPVTTDREAKSISQERTFGVDVHDPDELRRVLLMQTEQVAERLRAAGRSARGVTIKLRDGHFRTVTRSQALDEPTNRTGAIWHAAQALFERWEATSLCPLRLIGMGVTLAATNEQQMSLFSQESEVRDRQLDGVADAIRARFGADAIHRAAAVRRPRTDR